MTESTKVPVEQLQKGQQQVATRNQSTQVDLSGGPFASIDAFAAYQRMARVFQESELVPKRYRGEHKIGDCLIAMGISKRIGADPVMVMQNLYVVHGTPAWSGQFVIATINQSGLFREPLHFEEVGTPPAGPITCGDDLPDDWGYYAVGITNSGREINGPTITIGMAKLEGWLKNPKWLSMPQMMLRYRAGSWFGRSECPELLMGYKTREEVQDLKFINVDPETGEVIDDTNQARAVHISDVVNQEDAKPPAAAKDDDAEDKPPIDEPEATAEPEKAADEPEAKQEEKPADPDEQDPYTAIVKAPFTEIDNMSYEDQVAHRGFYRDHQTGAYFNAKGDKWTPSQHATSKEKLPVVNKDGSFRARRNVASAPPEPKQQEQAPEPQAKPEPEQPQHDERNPPPSMEGWE